MKKGQFILFLIFLSFLSSCGKVEETDSSENSHKEQQITEVETPSPEEEKKESEHPPVFNEPESPVASSENLTWSSMDEAIDLYEVSFGKGINYRREGWFLYENIGNSIVLQWFSNCIEGGCFFKFIKHSPYEIEVQEFHEKRFFPKHPARITYLDADGNIISDEYVALWSSSDEAIQFFEKVFQNKDNKLLYEINWDDYDRDNWILVEIDVYRMKLALTNDYNTDPTYVTLTKLNPIEIEITISPESYTSFYTILTDYSGNKISKEDSYFLKTCCKSVDENINFFEKVYQNEKNEISYLINWENYNREMWKFHQTLKGETILSLFNNNQKLIFIFSTVNEYETGIAVYQDYISLDTYLYSIIIEDKTYEINYRMNP